MTTIPDRSQLTLNRQLTPTGDPNHTRPNHRTDPYNPP